jgi:hypothetical protein
VESTETILGATVNAKPISEKLLRILNHFGMEEYENSSPEIAWRVTVTVL